jgi:SET domain
MRECLFDRQSYKRCYGVSTELTHPQAEQDDFYFASLGGGLMLDAKNMGSVARFANHSCEPNCELQKWSVLGNPTVELLQLKRYYTTDAMFEARHSILHVNVTMRCPVCHICHICNHDHRIKQNILS